MARVPESLAIFLVAATILLQLAAPAAGGLAPHLKAPANHDGHRPPIMANPMARGVDEPAPLGAAVGDGDNKQAETTDAEPKDSSSQAEVQSTDLERTVAAPSKAAEGDSESKVENTQDDKKQTPAEASSDSADTNDKVDEEKKGEDLQARQSNGGGAGPHAASPPSSGAGQQQQQTLLPPASNRQSGTPLFGNLLPPSLSPGNFLSNLLPGRNERRQIGETCQFSADCLAGTDNSVCFNGTCLCNIGYRYTADTKQCTAVDTCPTCATDSCTSGVDMYCNGTCIRNTKAITVKGLGETGKTMLNSPNWPENYPAGIDVYYCITASPGRKVNIQFDWLDLETNCGYNCDYVRVYNGCVGRPSELLVMFHGDNARSRECVTSNCNQMLVHFHTDGDKGGRGDQRSGFMGFLREATYANDLCNQCSSKN